MGLFTSDADCEACKRLQRGLTWTGKPPKCAKHSEHNVAWVDTDGVL